MSSIYTILEQAGYEPTIGLEVHVQLNTATKIFSSDRNGSSEIPNDHIHMVSLGLPGSLPVLNKEAVNKAIQFGLAVDAEINKKIFFDRKSYFYPDLPKGYQTTQDKAPICLRGRVEAFSEKTVGQYVDLHHTHLEEDAGKSVHDEGDDTLIDLNRAGSPLIEIVTEPCIRSGEVAAAFLQEIRRIVRFLNIGNANMEKGELRCDANISIKKKDASELGSKVEIKNMNSFNHVRRAIDFELQRQFELVEKHEEVLVETRTFDPSAGETYGMRFKETLNDYRYFPCPDLPPVLISDEMKEGVRSEMNKTPAVVRQEISGQGLTVSDVANLASDLATASYALQLIDLVGDAKLVANCIKGPIKGFLNDKGVLINELPRSIQDLGELLLLVKSGEVNASAAMQILFPRFISSQMSAKDLAKEENLIIQTDESGVEQLVKKVLLSLPEEVNRYQKGEKQLFGLFMGALMKQGGRQFDPKQLQSVLRKELSE